MSSSASNVFSNVSVNTNTVQENYKLVISGNVNIIDGGNLYINGSLPSSSASTGTIDTTYISFTGYATGAAIYANTMTSNSQFKGNQYNTGSSPSYSFTSDTTTGIFHPQSGVVAISSLGNEVMRISPTGVLTTATNYYIGVPRQGGLTNVALGQNALYNQLTTATSVVAIGNNAMFNGGGNYNTAVGNSAGYSMTGDNNTVLGYNAGYGSALGNANTYLGAGAGYSCTNPNYNTAVGYNALMVNSGQSNIALGLQAAYQNTVGSNNIILGVNAQTPSVSDSNVLLIGDTTGGLFGRNLYTSNFNLGIGTTSPKNKLDVNGSLAIGSYAGVTTGPTNGLLVSGNVGINTSSVNNALEVMGTTSTTNITFTGYATGASIYTNTLTSHIMTGSSLLTFNTATGSTFGVNTAYVNTLTSSTMTGSTLGVNTAYVNTLNASTMTGSSLLTFNTATGSTLGVNTAYVTTLTSSTMTGSTLGVNTAYVTTLTSSTMTGSTLGVNTAYVNTLNASTMTGSTLGVNTAYVNTLNASTMTGSSLLTFNTATGATLGVNTAYVNTLTSSTMTGSTLLTFNTATGATLGVNTAFVNTFTSRTMTGSSLLTFNTATGATLGVNNAFVNTLTSSTMTGSTLLTFNTATGSTLGVNTASVNATLSAGKVGVGINNPSFPIHVYSSIGATNYISTSNSLYLQDSNVNSDGGGSLIFGASAGYFAGIKGGLANDAQNTNGNLYFCTRTNTSDTNLSTKLTVFANGNIGIGTVTPTVKLDMFDTSTCLMQIKSFTGGNSYAGILLYNTGAAGGALFLNSSSRSTDGGAQTLTLRNDIGMLRLQDSTVSGITITGGKVGVATSSPSYILQVGAGGRLAISNGPGSLTIIGTQENDGVENTRIVLSEPTRTTYGGNIEYVAATGAGGNHIFYKPGVIEAVRISKTGYVGIGTSTPNAPLQFANTIANRKVVCYDGYNNDHQFYGFGINASMLRYQVDSGGACHAWYAGSSSTTSDELMRLQGNGYLGLGTTSPAVRLHVSESSTTATATYLKVTNASNQSLGAIFGQDASNNVLVYNQANAAILFATNNTETMRIDNTGKVGIGTTSPQNKLDVSGALAVGSYAGINTAPSNGMIVSGKVGMGTNSVNSFAYAQVYGSSTALEAITGTSASLYLQDSGSASYNGGSIIFGASQGFFAGIKGSIYDGTTNTIGNLNFCTRTLITDTSLTTKMTIRPSGNVGIGTVAPQSKLDVSGSLAVGSYAGVNAAPSNGLIVSGNVGVGTTTVNEKMNVTNTTSSATDGFVGVKFVKDLGSNDFSAFQHKMQFEISRYSDAKSLAIGVLDNGTVGIQAKQVSVGYNILSLNPVSGKVGVNTLSPQSNFDVSGSVSIGSYGGANAAPSNGLIVSGNVGIGTSSPNAALQLGNTTANRRIVLWESVNNDHQFYGFGINSYMLRYQVPETAGCHAFYAATSSSASTEIMRIQGNGTVGINTSSPNSYYKLDVNGNLNASIINCYQNQIITTDNSAASIYFYNQKSGGVSSSYLAQLVFYGYDNLGNNRYGAGIYVIPAQTFTSSAYGAYMDLYTTDWNSTSAKIRMRIGGSAGYTYFYAASASNGAYLVLDGTTYGSGRIYSIGSTCSSNTPGAGFLEFFDNTAGATRMCINSSGLVAMGGTNAYTNTGLTITTPNTTYPNGLWIDSPYLSYGYSTTMVIGVGASQGNNQAQIGFCYQSWGSSNNFGFLQLNGIGGMLCWVGTYRVGIFTATPSYTFEVSGDINALGSVRSYGTALASDYRIKTDITSVSPLTCLDMVNKFKVRQYDYISSWTNEGTGVIGFIAQECAEVDPNCVSYGTNFIPNVNETVNLTCIFTPTIITEPQPSGSTGTVGEQYIYEFTTSTGTLQLDDYVMFYNPVKRTDISNVPTYCTIISATGTTYCIQNKDPIPNVMYCYGKQVKDFNFLSKDRIFAYGIGAIQDLSTELTTAKSRITTLEEQNQFLTQRLTTSENNYNSLLQAILTSTSFTDLQSKLQV